MSTDSNLQRLSPPNASTQQPLVNLRAIRSIYMFEMARTARTLFQSIVSPVVSTSLYFVVFGAAIGTRIQEIESVNYGAFIVPGLIILATAWLFVPLRIDHPLFMLGFLVLTAVTFSLLGFIIGIWADGFEQLQLIPLLVLTPLTFLGGTFYSIDVLPPFWQTVALFNPIVYLVSGFRWSFFSIADVGVGISLTMTFVFLILCLVTVWWIFKTGYRLKR
jgi:ABC-2 type transport system permease protein